jgi:hypothetical protein
MGESTRERNPEPLLRHWKETSMRRSPVQIDSGNWLAFGNEVKATAGNGPVPLRKAVQQGENSQEEIPWPRSLNFRLLRPHSVKFSIIDWEITQQHLKSQIRFRFRLNCFPNVLFSQKNCVSSQLLPTNFLQFIFILDV